MVKNFRPEDKNLWDEIFNTIVDVMPEQLFPLFKEVYGKEYPKGTPVIRLSTVSSTYLEDPDAPPSSRRSDTAILVNGTDYYHLECQMHNDEYMVIRMITYDIHFAMQHSTSKDEQEGGFIMRFPSSAVIYPEKNRELPETLRCRIIFQDGSQHIYQVPTVRIQSYSMQEICDKHLLIFIPYVLLRLRPKLNPNQKNPLTEKELTDLVNEAIVILQKELEQGNLTRQEYSDYLNLFRFAADKIFKDKKHSKFRKEVHQMTSLYDQLPSVREKRLCAKLEGMLEEMRLEKENALDALARKEAELAEKEAEYAKKEAERAKNEAELVRLKEILDQHHIVLTP